MRNLLLFLGLFVGVFCTAQSKVDSLVQVGVGYHDKGEYAKALEIYKEALAIDPKSAAANYEMSFTYYSTEDWDNALKYSDIAIGLGDKDISVLAYSQKGSIQDDMGDTKGAIKTYSKAMKEYGDNYILLFNRGISYGRIKDYKHAEADLGKAISLNFERPGTHYNLGKIMLEQGNRVQGLLCLYYFLLLEPNTERAKYAFNTLESQLNLGVSASKKNDSDVNVVLSTKNMGSEYSLAEVLISISIAATYDDKNKGESPQEQFEEITKGLFNVVGELKEDRKKSGDVWWDFYIPFFADMVKNNQTEVFCEYISQSADKGATTWIDVNPTKVKSFNEWYGKWQ